MIRHVTVVLVVCAGSFGAGGYGEQANASSMREAGPGQTGKGYLPEFDGTLTWACRAGGSSDDYGYSIAALGDGSALVTGSFWGTAVFGAGEANETTLVSAGSYDLFVAKYWPNGRLAWARRAGGTAADVAYGIAALDDGSALVTGWFGGTAIFGPGEAGQTTLVSAGADDVFVAKYGPNGRLAWARRSGGNSDDEGYGVAVLDDRSALVTGDFSGTATFGPGEANETTLVSGGGYDLFVAKYGSDGGLAWARRAGGTSGDFGDGIAGLDYDGSALVAGQFEGTAIFGPGEAKETTLVSVGYSDVFVAKYGPDGRVAWARRAGGANSDIAQSIAVLLTDGSALVTGYFYSTATFGPGEAKETTLVSEGSYDIFVAEYGPDGTLAWARRAGGSSADYGNGIAALDDGSALVTGEFEGTATFGLGEADETTLTSAGGSFDRDIFLAKYGPDGTLAWAGRAGGTTADHAQAIARYKGESALLTGWFGGTTTFGPGEANETALVSAGPSDVFVAKYTSGLDSDNDGIPDGMEVRSDADVDGSGAVDAIDVQLVINAALGIPTGFDCDVNHDGSVDAIDVQLVINAALGF